MYNKRLRYHVNPWFRSFCHKFITRVCPSTKTVAYLLFRLSTKIKLKYMFPVGLTFPKMSVGRQAN